MKTIFLLMSISIISGCKKTSPSAVGDEVIGTYKGFYAALPVNIEVYKTGEQKYGIRKLSTVPFPEFTIQYKLSLFGLTGYSVPPQGNLVSDSSSATYD